jgi:hypothetical protein
VEDFGIEMEMLTAALYCGLTVLCSSNHNTLAKTATLKT